MHLDIKIMHFKILKLEVLWILILIISSKVNILKRTLSFLLLFTNFTAFHSLR